MSNSYESFTKDFNKNKTPITILFAIFVIVVVGVLISGMRGLNKVDDKNNDYKIEKLMWSTQEALEDYYKENNIYPDNLNTLLIKHTDNTFEITGPNEIEYIGYKIMYILTNGESYTLETYLKMNDERYVLYSDE